MAAVRAVLAVTFLAAARGVQILEGSAAERVSRDHHGKLAMPEELKRDAEAVGEEIDTHNEDVPSDAVVINATEGSVAFKEWYGRTGNNIVQLVNAILFCQVEGFSTLRLPEASKSPCHDKSKACRATDLFDLPEEIKITPRPELKLKCNFRGMKFFFGRCLAVTKSLFRQTAAQHLLPFMSEAWDRTCQEERAQQDAHHFNGLTIHLRSGDSRNSTGRIPSSFSYASCSFFKKVLAVHKFQSARVVTEKDMSHPCIQVLRKELGSNLVVQSGSLEEDSCAIMHARHLAVGSWSTFSQVLELFNDRLETNFWPVPPNTTKRSGIFFQIGAVCNPVVFGSATTYVYQVDGMQEGHNQMDGERSADYFSRLPLENVTLRSVCDEQSEAPFEGSVSLR
jgi:hypothetical protein